MRMIVSQDEANHLCAFDRWPAGEVASLTHTRQDAPLHGFQTVPRIGQRPVGHNREAIGSKGLGHNYREIFFADDACFCCIVFCCASHIYTSSSLILRECSARKTRRASAFSSSISSLTRRAASTPSSIETRLRVRCVGSNMVSRNSRAFISPRPLKRLNSRSCASGRAFKNCRRASSSRSQVSLPLYLTEYRGGQAMKTWPRSIRSLNSW